MGEAEELAKATHDWAERHPEPDQPVIFIGGKEMTPKQFAEFICESFALGQWPGGIVSFEELIASFEGSG